MNLLSEIHFWTAREDVLIKHCDFGAFKYFNKRDANGGRDVLADSKRNYCEWRGGTWDPINKRPFWMRDKLKELENYLYQDKIVCCMWEDCTIRLLLTNGVLAHIALDAYANSPAHVSFDKSLAVKLGSEAICDAAVLGDRTACICTDGRVFGSGGPWKEGWTMECGGKKRIGMHDQLLCVWGNSNVEYPQPWSPLVKDYRRANLLLYRMTGARPPEMLAYKRIEGDLIEVILSRVCSKTVIVVEQKVSSRGAVAVEVGTLEATVDKLKRLSITSVPLQTQVSCCTVSGDENQLMLGCIDGCVAVLDRRRGSTRIIKTSIIPTLAVWHCEGAVAAVMNVKGQLQYFDAALNRINVQLSGEDCTSTGLLDLSAYFVIHPNVSFAHWGPKHLLVALERGPIVLISHLDDSLAFAALIRRYTKAGRIDRGVGLLLSREWDERCFSALQRIVAHLSRLPLTEGNARDLKNTLSSFHSPRASLSADVHHKYGTQVRALTRRFFHQLVRYQLFETAFLLAVDIGHHDLFMDLYHCALQIGEREMAAAARAQASALLSRCSSAASCCSRSSCSKYSGCYSGDDSSGSGPSSPPNERNKQRQLPSGFALTFNDNCLTTNFNNINPLTYNSNGNFGSCAPATVPTVAPPKVASPTKSVFNSVASRDLPPPVPPYAPPLPITPPPFPHNVPLSIHNYSASTNFPNAPLVCSAKAAENGLTESVPRQINTPPLPFAPPFDPNIPLSVPQAADSSAGPHGGKKQPAKVKFSDTVTAFIVPEVKRPVRPPPPPHITDPQKELADSLPLCHPNEDYLKDFTPVRRNEPEEKPPTAHNRSKIKVIHFGVV